MNYFHGFIQFMNVLLANSGRVDESTILSLVYTKHSMFTTMEMEMDGNYGLIKQTWNSLAAEKVILLSVNTNRICYAVCFCRILNLK